MSLLAGVCDFAQSYNHQLPDYICEQTTTRSESQATTVLKAQVTFEPGHERYSNVTVNGKAVDAVSPDRAYLGLGFARAVMPVGEAVEQGKG